MLTESESNTLEISGKLNRTAERYMEIIRRHGIEITESERTCLVSICNIGFMAPHEISELPDEVRASVMELDGLDKEQLAGKLAAASFADLVAMVEQLGF